MSSAGRFRALTSGASRGPLAVLLRGLLRLIEFPYTLAVRWRNFGFDTGRLPAHRAAVPVISIGNLTLGGTGKTPLVAWVARRLRDRGLRVVLISRGYGAKEGKSNDEARELALQLPDVPHLQNPDRVAASARAVAELGAQAIVLDDGFQHRRLARDLDIVLLDATEPFGYGHVFPRGMLREPIASLARADVVALSRADMVAPSRREEIRAIVSRYNPQAPWVEMRHAPQRLVAASGTATPLDSLRGARVLAFCGIGNPAGFRHTLEECGFLVCALREFPDHHAYDAADIDALARAAQEQHATALVCTQKDVVKLSIDAIKGLPVWAVEIGLEITTGEAALDARLQALFAPRE